jgi:hypothetical protein
LQMEEGRTHGPVCSLFMIWQCGPWPIWEPLVKNVYVLWLLSQIISNPLDTFKDFCMSYYERGHVTGKLWIKWHCFSLTSWISTVMGQNAMNGVKTWLKYLNLTWDRRASIPSWISSTYTPQLRTMNLIERMKYS